MREDDRFRHVVPLLRRTIILVAVIIAVPVVLWTITAFVRTYVGQPRIPTFHQLAATAKMTAPAASTISQATAQLPQDADASNAVVEARATISDAATRGDQPDGMASGAAPKSDASSVFPPSPLGAQGGSITGSLATTEPTPNNDEPNTATAATGLPDPIPLPRRRPRNIEMRTADNANVPMPRRRPETAGSTSSETTSGNSPLGFIQNIFH